MEESLDGLVTQQSCLFWLHNAQQGSGFALQHFEDDSLVPVYAMLANPVRGIKLAGRVNRSQNRACLD